MLIEKALETLNISQLVSLGEELAAWRLYCEALSCRWSLLDR